MQKCIASFVYLCIPEIHLILLEHLPADHAPVVDDDVKMCPCTELTFPVGNGGEWGDDEEWSFNAHTINLL